MSEKKRILVIGAGASGITSIKACKEENFDVVCYEKTGDFGGLWRYHDGDMDGLPSVMKSTISNTSKEMSLFSDFPAPSHYPIYLPHFMVIKYLELYAEEFDLLSHIRYYHEIVLVTPAEDYVSSGKFVVTVRDLHRDETREEIFDGVMVCSGHHAFPHFPSYLGLDSYSGQVLHSHSYKSFNGMEGKKVLVIGAGNSGTDIAVELSNIASKVYLSTRRGTWIIPRMMQKGKPFDVCVHRRSKFLQPSSYATWNLEKFIQGKMDHKKFGIQPYHKVNAQHPTVNDDLQSRLISGTVILKRDVKEFAESGAIFEGEEEATQLDVVILATGYSIKFPFLNDQVLKITKNKAYLYKNVFPPPLKHSTIGIIGLIQSNGGLFPIFEIQARWFMALMAGRVSLPYPDKMLADVRSTEDNRARNYVQSQRHTIEAPWLPYTDDIASKIGAKPNLLHLIFTDPKLFWACLTGPCLPYQYRLNGSHAWSGARQAILTYKERMYAPLKSVPDKK